MTQPEALRLAEILEGGSRQFNAEAAAELRRLHAENAKLRGANNAFDQRQEWWNERMFVLEQQRDELLEALKMLVLATNKVSIGDYNEEVHDIALSKARAAIAKAQQ